MTYNPRTPNGLKKQKEKIKFTHEDIEEAIRKFQTSGGLIQKLSDQITPTDNIIYPKYENRVEEFIDLY